MKVAGNRHCPSTQFCSEPSRPIGRFAFRDDGEGDQKQTIERNKGCNLKEQEVSRRRQDNASPASEREIKRVASIVQIYRFILFFFLCLKL